MKILDHFSRLKGTFQLSTIIKDLLITKLFTRRIKWLWDNLLLLVIVSLALLLFFKNKSMYLGWIEQHVFQPLVFEPNVFLTIFHALLIIVSVKVLAKLISSETVLPKWIICGILIYLFLYWNFRYEYADLFSPIISNPTITFWGLQPTFTDLYSILCILYLLVSGSILMDLSDHFDLRSKASGLLSDSPEINIKNDLLNYKVDAQGKIGTIFALDRDRNWSIAITAPWGHGKTTYLNYLIQGFLDDVEIIQFNPRCVSSSSAIQTEFLDILGSKLSKYDYSLKYNIQKYVSILKNIKDLAWTEKVITLLFSLDKSTLKDKINHALSHINKKVIVIIDDLDRLDATELKEVFKILRGNADFHNMIYITAFDKEYVAKQMGDESYIDKFFDIKYSLPVILPDDIIGFIKGQINEKLSLSNENSQDYEQIIETHKALLLKHIHTLRKAKELINSILVSYPNAYVNLNFEDILLLSLLKILDEKRYLTIYIEPHTFTNGIYDYESNDNEKYQDILDLLFKPNSKNNDARKIYNQDFFDCYFKYSIENAIDKEKLKYLFDTNDLNEIKQILKKECAKARKKVGQFCINYYKDLGDQKEKLKGRYIYILCLIESLQHQHFILWEIERLLKESSISEEEINSLKSELAYINQNGYNYRSILILDHILDLLKKNT